MVAPFGTSGRDRLAGLSRTGELVAYFGYGSLVNTATHRTRIVHHERASLAGFSRSWQGRPDIADHPIALLSAGQVSAASLPVLPGLLVVDLAKNLAAIDEREAGYDRITIDHRDLAFADRQFALPEGVDVHVYTARAPARPGEPHHILQSYLDAVLQGYMHQYGQAAAAAFVATTRRFDIDVLADRAAPLYPRAVKLTTDEQAVIDRATATLRFVTL